MPIPIPLPTPAARNPYVSSDRICLVDFYGYGFTPAVIQTGRGDIRLLRLPYLGAFAKKRPINQCRAAANAEVYFKNTTLEKGAATIYPMEVMHIPRASVSDINRLLRKDVCLRKAILRPNQFFREQAVTVGQPVTALGYYSAAYGGLVPYFTSFGFDDQDIYLIPGDSKTACRDLFREQAIKFIVSLICMVISQYLIFSVIPNP